MKSIERKDILRLVAETELDPRTIQRAVDSGISSMKSEKNRESLRAAAKRLGLKIKE